MKRIFSVLMSIVIALSCVVFIMPPNIVLAANNADDIVSIARGELGSTNYSKYYGGNKGAWCADFVSWCAQQAGVDSIAKSSSCYNMYIGMKNNGCQEVSSPQKGDIVFFYCTKCSSTAGKWCHVGIMEDSTYSIEGNRWSNGVSKVERGNSYSHNGDLGYKHRDGIVRKYLRPKYSVPNPPTYSNFWVDHYLFDLSETVSFTAVASGADNYTIGIDKTGVGRVVTEGCGSTYTISADRLGAGEYSAYMTVANSAGYVDTYRVYFVVVEKCNFGDKFSARIQNIGTGCYITNKDSKIVGAPESGYNDQIWFFNKCSDGSYTIMSQLDGLMMDDEWDSDVPAGADIRAWSATGQDKQRFNIYYMDDAFYIRPANTKTLVVDMGAGEPYNVACYNLSRNAGQQKYRFDMVGMGDYIPYGLGDEFYAQLRCQSNMEIYETVKWSLRYSEYIGWFIYRCRKFK